MYQTALRITTAMSWLGVLALLGPGPAANAADPLRDLSRASVKRLDGSNTSRIPLYFEPNRGQVAPAVKFLARGPDYRIFLTSTEAVIAIGTAATPLRTTFIGADSQARVVGLDQLPAKVNYFRGRTPASWHTNVPTYAKAAYLDLYPGIDLVYHAERGGLEYDFIVAPSADPNTILLGFDGVERLELTAVGDLILHTKDGMVRQGKPVVFQEIGDDRRIIDARFVLHGARQIGFAVDAYDPSRPLVIDPTLAFSSYLGGSRVDIGQHVALDAAGNIYFTGCTVSADFPTANATPLPGPPFDDAFVVKVSADGSTLLYATYFGGSGNDNGLDLALDAAGRVYIAGATNSPDFPTHNAFDVTLGGFGDGFLVQLDVAGDAFLYATYLGGSDTDFARGLAVDSLGQVYITGETGSSDFPTVNPLQRHLRGTFDVFVTKFNASGTSLIFSTYLGGSDHRTPGDFGTAIAVDIAGNVYVTGSSGSRNFPTYHALQSQLDGESDAFIAKIRSDGSRLVYSTLLGGSGSQDVGRDIVVDSAGRATIGGFTNSINFPTVSAIQPQSGGSFDVFVAQVDAAGAALVFSTYLGGSESDFPGGIALDGAGNVYVTGTTSSTDFPLVSPIQSSFGGGGRDAFAARYAANGATLVYSTFLGGEDQDEGSGIAADATGHAYVTGVTRSVTFPVLNALQPARAGDFDAFFAKINP